MKRWVVLLALCLVGTVAQAKGVPFAVGSLQQAQALAKQDASKHLLVFYTHEN